MDGLKVIFTTGAEPEGLLDFLRLSFPDVTQDVLTKVLSGKNFIRFEYGRIDSTLVACVAIFAMGRDHSWLDDDTYRMGLFCVHPDYRRKGIGKLLYTYLLSKYEKIQWTASSEDAYEFYKKMGARYRGIRRDDLFHIFTSE